MFLGEENGESEEEEEKERIYGGIRTKGGIQECSSWWWCMAHAQQAFKKRGRPAKPALEEEHSEPNGPSQPHTRSPACCKKLEWRPPPWAFGRM